MPEAARAGRRPSRQDGPQRPGVRPPPLPLGRRAGEIRAGVREDQKRTVMRESARRERASAAALTMARSGVGCKRLLAAIIVSRATDNALGGDDNDARCAPE